MAPMLPSVGDGNSKLENTQNIADQPKAKEPKCYLLELPAELRNRIYEFAVIEDKEISIVKPGTICPMLACETLEPNLSLASRQLRAEVLPIFYSDNDFVIDLVSPAGEWMNRQCCEEHFCESFFAVRDTCQPFLGMAFKWLQPRVLCWPELKKVATYCDLPDELLEPALHGLEEMMGMSLGAAWEWNEFREERFWGESKYRASRKGFFNRGSSWKSSNSAD